MSVQELFLSVKEIEASMKQLTPAERSDLASMLIEKHHEEWDKQIEADLEAGRLDRWLDEVRKEHEAGLSKPL